MASIERTAYPRFPRILTLKDLQASFTPKPEEIEWAQQQSRTPQRRLALLVLLKCFEFLRHFPALDAIPAELSRISQQRWASLRLTRSNSLRSPRCIATTK